MYDLYPSYDSYDYGSAAAREETLGVFVGIYLLVLLISLAASLVTYVLQSVGLYGMTKTLGLSNPWLAWIPVGNLWCIGRVAEQSNVYYGKKKGSLRIALLLMYLALLLFLPVFLFLSVAAGMNSAFAEPEEAVGFVLILLLMFFFYMVLAVALSVVIYVALYKVYKLFDPDNAVLYLVLSIFIGICQPIFFFILRNRLPGGGKTPPAANPPYGGQPPFYGQPPYGFQGNVPPQNGYYNQPPAGFPQQPPQAPPTQGYDPSQNPDGKQ